MATAPIISTGRSKEDVALKLLEIIAVVEKKRIVATGTGSNTDRGWVLDTYAECLEAVESNRVFTKGAR